MSNVTYINPEDSPHAGRPQTSLFMKLARLLQDLDGDSGRWHGGLADFLHRNQLDPETMFYVADQRAHRACQALPSEIRVFLVPVLAAAYVDGFALGLEFGSDG